MTLKLRDARLSGLLRLLLIFFAIYFAFFIAVYYPPIYEVRAFHHLLMTGVLAIWLVHRLRKGSLPVTPLSVPLLALAGAWLLSAVTGIVPRVSLEYVWQGLILLGLYGFFVGLLRSGREKLVIETLFLAVFTIGLVSLIEVGVYAFGLGIVPNSSLSWLEYGLPPRWPPLTFAAGNSNQLAGLLAPAIVVIAGWGLTARQASVRWPLVSLAALLLIPLVVANSRGALISLAVAALTLALLWLWRRVGGHAAPARLKVGFGLLPLGAFVGLLGVIVWQLDNARGLLWSAAWQLFLSDPLTGIGYGAYGTGIRSILTSRYDMLATAHNVPLNVAAELGLIGLAAVGWVAWGTFWAGYRRWAGTAADPDWRAGFVLAALVGLAAHSLVDVLTSPATGLLVVILAAYLTVRFQPEAEARQPVTRPWLHRGLIAGALCLTLGYGVGLYVSDQAAFAARSSLLAANDAEALAQIETAQTLDPALNLYQLQEVYLLGQRAQDDESLRSVAIAAYEGAIRLEPNWVTGWLNLAAFYEQAGRIQDAAGTLAHIQSRDGTGQSWLHWARLAETHNLADDADIIAAYFESMAYQMPLSSFWWETPLRQAAVRDYVAAAEEDDDVMTQFRVWQAHDPERLSDLVPTVPETHRDYWVIGQMALMTGDYSAARRAFDMAVELSPMQGDYYVLRASTYTRADPQAEEDLRLAAWYGTRFESINRVRATWAQSDEDRLTYRASMLSARRVRQVYAQVGFNRLALFDVLPAMRLPGPSDAALEHGYWVVDYFINQGEMERAHLALRAILDVAPFDMRAQVALDQWPE